MKKMMAAKEKLEGGSHAPNQQPKKTEIVSLTVQIVNVYMYMYTYCMRHFYWSVCVFIHVPVNIGWE